MILQGDLVVLFHGPDVFDLGHAKSLMGKLGDARFFQAGTMGRTAAHDNGLENIVTIPDLPGKVVARSTEIGSLIIAICPRTRDSGKSFVKIIMENSGIKAPLMHLDFSNKTFVIWQGDFEKELLERIRDMGFSEDMPKTSANRFERRGGAITRKLSDCKVGDFVLCSNILIGTATSPNMSITVEKGRITHTEGISVKPHGVEKLERLGPIDILGTKCCSTSNLRGDNVAPRVTVSDGAGVVFINHAGSEVYELSEGCEGALVVGDDTSRIVGDILYRFEMPIIAITDGDRDGLIKHDRFTEGSVVFKVDHDDDVGEHLYQKLFNKSEKLDMPFEAVKEKVHSIICNRVKECRVY